MWSAERDVVTDVQPFALGFSYGWPLTRGKLLSDISGKRNKPEVPCFWKCWAPTTPLLLCSVLGRIKSNSNTRSSLQTSLDIMDWAENDQFSCFLSSTHVQCLSLVKLTHGSVEKQKMTTCCDSALLESSITDSDSCQKITSSLARNLQCTNKYSII